MDNTTQSEPETFEMAKKTVERRVAGRESEIVALNKCFVDPEVQRGEKTKHLDQMQGDNFNDKAVRNLVVSKRSDGRFSILDGQHRWLLCLLQDFTHVYAEVHYGLTIEEEALLFELLNSSKPVSTADKFRVAMIQKNSNESWLAATVIRFGCQLKLRKEDKHDNLITAIGPLQKAMKSGGQPHIEMLMKVLMTAFVTGEYLQSAARSSRFITGLSIAISDAAKKGYDAHLIGSRLHHVDSSDILSEARSNACGNGWKEVDRVAKVLTTLINTVTRKKKAA